MWRELDEDQIEHPYAIGHIFELWHRWKWLPMMSTRMKWTHMDEVLQHT